MYCGYWHVVHVGAMCLSRFLQLQGWSVVCGLMLFPLQRENAAEQMRLRRHIDDTEVSRMTSKPILKGKARFRMIVQHVLCWFRDHGTVTCIIPCALFSQRCCAASCRHYLPISDSCDVQSKLCIPISGTQNAHGRKLRVADCCSGVYVSFSHLQRIAPMHI
jgi:hypothetical protein